MKEFEKLTFLLQAPQLLQFSLNHETGPPDVSKGTDHKRSQQSDTVAFGFQDREQKMQRSTSRGLDGVTEGAAAQSHSTVQPLSTKPHVAELRWVSDECVIYQVPLAHD